MRNSPDPIRTISTIQKPIASMCSRLPSSTHSKTRIAAAATMNKMMRAMPPEYAGHGGSGARLPGCSVAAAPALSALCRNFAQLLSCLERAGRTQNSKRLQAAHSPVRGWWIGPGTSSVREVELKVTCRPQGEYVVMSVQGEIDLYTVPRLQRELAGVLASAGPVRLVVDLSGVDFCDSTGVNVLLAAHRQARETGGDLELAAPRPAVRKILQVTGLEAVFTVTDNPAQAVGR